MKFAIIETNYREYDKNEIISSSTNRNIIGLRFKNVGQDPVEINGDVLGANEILPFEAINHATIINTKFNIKFKEQLPTKKLGVWETIVVGTKEINI